MDPSISNYGPIGNQKEFSTEQNDDQNISHQLNNGADISCLDSPENLSTNAQTLEKTELKTIDNVKENKALNVDELAAGDPTIEKVLSKGITSVLENKAQTPAPTSSASLPNEIQEIFKNLPRDTSEKLSKIPNERILQAWSKLDTLFKTHPNLLSGQRLETTKNHCKALFIQILDQLSNYPDIEPQYLKNLGILGTRSSRDLSFFLESILRLSPSRNAFSLISNRKFQTKYDVEAQYRALMGLFQGLCLFPKDIQEIISSTWPEIDVQYLLRNIPKEQLTEALTKLNAALETNPNILRNKSNFPQYYYKAILLKTMAIIALDPENEKKTTSNLFSLLNNSKSLESTLESLIKLSYSKNANAILRDLEIGLLTDNATCDNEIKALLNRIESIQSFSPEIQDIVLMTPANKRDDIIQSLKLIPADKTKDVLTIFQTALERNPEIFRTENEASQAYCKALLIKLIYRIAENPQPEDETLSELFIILDVAAEEGLSIQNFLEELTEYPDEDLFETIHEAISSSETDVESEIESEGDTHNPCSIDVNPKELKENPRKVLHNLCQELEPEHDFLDVDFGDEGADQGGLGRQLISELFKGIKDTFLVTDQNKKTYDHTMHLAALNNGLFRPELFLGNDGNYKSLSDDDKQTLHDIGKLLMFLIVPGEINSYPIGNIFDQGVFTAIVQLGGFEPAHLENYNPSIFNDLLSIYSDMLKHNEDEQNYFTLIKQYLKPIDVETNEKTLYEAFSLAALDDEFAKLNIKSGDFPKIFEYYPQIQEAIRRSIFQQKIQPAFIPLLEIIDGMKKANFDRLNWEYIQNLDPTIFSVHIQGLVSGKEISNSLNFSEDIPIEIEQGFKEWIENASLDKRKKFLFAVTGSPALGAKKIRIQEIEYEAMHFHTCNNQIDLNCDDLMKTGNAKAALWEGIEVAIDVIDKDKGYDRA